MNDLFAIDPESLIADDHQYYSAFADRFGFETGLFLVDAPEDWITRMLTLAPPDSGIKRSRLLEFLNDVRKKSLLLEIERISGDLDWSVATAISDRGNLVNLISKNQYYPNSVLYELMLGKQRDKLNPRRAMVAQGTAQNFLKVLTPLILDGGEIHLIDKYVTKNILSRDMVQQNFYLEFFAGVAEISKVSPRPIKSFCIHIFDSRETPSKPYLEDRLDKIFSKKLSDCWHLLNINVIESDVPYEDIHKRYILGRRGGVELDAGLRADFEKKRQFNYIDKQVHLDLWAEHVSSRM